MRINMNKREKIEKIKTKDQLSVVLTKADGTIITNEPIKITAEFLKALVEEMKASSRSRRNR